MGKNKGNKRGNGGRGAGDGPVAQKTSPTRPGPGDGNASDLVHNAKAPEVDSPNWGPLLTWVLRSKTRLFERIRRIGTTPVGSEGIPTEVLTAIADAVKSSLAGVGGNPDGGTASALTSVAIRSGRLTSNWAVVVLPVSVLDPNVASPDNSARGRNSSNDFESNALNRLTGDSAKVQIVSPKPTEEAPRMAVLDAVNRLEALESWINQLALGLEEALAEFPSVERLGPSGTPAKSGLDGSKDRLSRCISGATFRLSELREANRQIQAVTNVLNGALDPYVEQIPVDRSQDLAGRLKSSLALLKEGPRAIEIKSAALVTWLQTFRARLHALLKASATGPDLPSAYIERFKSPGHSELEAVAADLAECLEQTRKRIAAAIASEGIRAALVAQIRAVSPGNTIDTKGLDDLSLAAVREVQGRLERISGEEAQASSQFKELRDWLSRFADRLRPLAAANKDSLSGLSSPPQSGAPANRVDQLEAQVLRDFLSISQRLGSACDAESNYLAVKSSLSAISDYSQGGAPIAEAELQLSRTGLEDSLQAILTRLNYLSKLESDVNLLTRVPLDSLDTHAGIAGVGNIPDLKRRLLGLRDDKSEMVDRISRALGLLNGIELVFAAQGSRRLDTALVLLLSYSVCRLAQLQLNPGAPTSACESKLMLENIARIYASSDAGGVPQEQALAASAWARSLGVELISESGSRAPGYLQWLCEVANHVTQTSHPFLLYGVGVSDECRAFRIGRTSPDP